MSSRCTAGSRYSLKEAMAASTGNTWLWNSERVSPFAGLFRRPSGSLLSRDVRSTRGSAKALIAFPYLKYSGFE